MPTTGQDLIACGYGISSGEAFRLHDVTAHPDFSPASDYSRLSYKKCLYLYCAPPGPSARFDVDGDGVISRPDMQEAVSQLGLVVPGESRDEVAEQCLSGLGADEKCPMISFEEFKVPRPISQ